MREDLEQRLVALPPDERAIVERLLELPLDAQREFRRFAERLLAMSDEQRQAIAGLPDDLRWHVSGNLMRPPGAVSLTDEFLDLTPENTIHLSADQMAEIEAKQAAYWGHAARVAMWSREQRRRQLQRAPKPSRPMPVSRPTSKPCGHGRERRPISRRAAARAPGGDDDPPSDEPRLTGLQRVERLALVELDGHAEAWYALAAFAEARGDRTIGGVG
jgi:hypothetical protein